MAEAISFPCPRCQQPLSVPGEPPGATVVCPACQTPIRVPMPAGAGPDRPAQATSSHLCAICQSPFGADESRSACPDCQAEYHADCWTENRGCAVYGCPQVPPTEARDTLELPVSYWGQEHKICPVCNAQILAAAVRCKICGTTFDSAQPQDAEQFLRQANRVVRAPVLRKHVVWVFVLCLVPFLAPLALVGGTIWYWPRRKDISALPSLYGALIKIGLAVGAGQTLIILVALMVAAIRHQ